MSGKRFWWSARELADAKLPGLPHSRQNCSIWIAKQRAEQPAMCRPRSGKVGGWEVHKHALPPEAQKALTGNRASNTSDSFMSQRYSKVKHYQDMRKFIQYEINPEIKQLRYRLLLAEILLDFSTQVGLSVRAVSRQFADGIVFNKALIAEEFLFIPPMRPNKFSSLKDQKKHSRDLIAEYDRAFICEDDLRRIVYNGRWKRGSSNQAARSALRLSNLLRTYIEELNVPSVKTAIDRFEFAYNMNLPVPYDALITLVRDKYILGVPLTKAGLRSMINDPDKLHAIQICPDLIYAGPSNDASRSYKLLIKIN